MGVWPASRWTAWCAFSCSWKQAREGQPNVDRNVTVTLLDEERNSVWTWRFRNAFPVNYRTTPLDANCSDIVAEELTLTFDSMDIE